MKSKPEYIPIEIIEKLKCFAKSKKLKFNKPKTKGQYTLTKKSKEVIGIPINEFSLIYENEMMEAKKIIDKIIKELPFDLKINNTTD